MQALIGGAGIAGLTLAWHLERSGWEVELVERAPAFRDGGYMIDFTGPGYDVAARMGLKPRLLELRYPMTRVDFLDRNGCHTSSLAMPADIGHVISLLRGDLARSILDDVRSPVRYGVSIERIEQADGKVAARLTDGSQREVDLLVGADGVHSQVRELVFGPERRFLRYLRRHAASYLVADEVLSRQIGIRYEMLTAPGRMVAVYGLGDGRLGTLFLRREPDPMLPDDPVAALRRGFGDLGWIVPQLLCRTPEPPALYYDQVTQVEMDRWSHQRVVLLGDACQAVSLFAAHGASLAMAAAWVLAEEVNAAGDDLSGALDRYQQRMQPVIVETQKFGRRVVEWTAPSTQWRITGRDWLLRLAALPGLNRLLLKSVMPGIPARITPRSTGADQATPTGAGG